MRLSLLPPTTLAAKVCTKPPPPFEERGVLVARLGVSGKQKAKQVAAQELG